MGIEARYYDLTHGWHGFLTFYVLIALFSFAGMRRGRASWEQYFYWPFASLATMVVVGISLGVLGWLLSTFAGISVRGFGGDMLAVVWIMAGGFIGGLYWAARDRPRAVAAGRGAMVFDGAPAQVATQKIRAQALKQPTRTAGICRDSIRQRAAM